MLAYVVLIRLVLIVGNGRVAKYSPFEENSSLLKLNSSSHWMLCENSKVYPDVAPTFQTLQAFSCDELVTKN